MSETAGTTAAGMPLTADSEAAGSSGMPIEATPKRPVPNAPTGSPFDPDVPPWPVYNDPARPAALAREQDEEARRAHMQNADGSVYVYQGPADPADGTERVLTHVGSVSKGEQIKLTDEYVQELRGSGHRFRKVAEGRQPVQEQPTQEQAAVQQEKPASRKQAGKGGES